MTMSSSTLSTQLQAVSGSTEGAAITSWTTAWASYFAESGVNGNSFTVNSTYINTAKTAMAAAMTGLSTSGQGPTKIQAGIVAWWDTLVANPSNYFTGSGAITKPSGLTNIASNLQPILDANKDNSRTTSASCDNVAVSIHSDNSGGTADYAGAQTIQ